MIRESKKTACRRVIAPSICNAQMHRIHFYYCRTVEMREFSSEQEVEVITGNPNAMNATLSPSPQSLAMIPPNAASSPIGE